MALDLNSIATSTERHSLSLKLHPGVLQPGQSYTFTLNASLPDSGRWGSASMTILPNIPPHGGHCDLSPELDIHLLDTVVTFNCSGNAGVLRCYNVQSVSPMSQCFTSISLMAGWQDDKNKDPQLIYTFQVAPCHPNGTMCPLLTLYR